MGMHNKTKDLFVIVNLFLFFTHMRLKLYWQKLEDKVNKFQLGVTSLNFETLKVLIYNTQLEHNKKHQKILYLFIIIEFSVLSIAS